MASKYLELPKGFHSDFQNPKAKPVGEVEIDWNHPLAKGLTLCMPFQMSGYVDLVKQGRRAVFNGDAKRTPEGVLLDESGDYLVIPDVVIDSAYTIVTHVDFTDNDGSNFQYFLSTGSFQATNTINWYLGESSNRMTATHDSSANNLFVETDEYPAINNLAYTLAVDGRDAGLYFDGRFILGRADYGSVAIADGTTTSLWVGTRGDLNADRMLGGTEKYVYIYNRKLSAAEIKKLAESPYCFLKPKQPSYLMIQAAAPPSTFQVAWAMNSNIYIGEHAA